MGLVRASSGSIRLFGEELTRPQTGRHRAARHRLRPAGPPALAVPDRRRAPSAGAGIAAQRLDDRAHLRRLSAARRAQEPSRRRIVGRRAADAGDLARAAAQSAPAGHGRADRRPGAGDRRPGRGHADPARRGRRGRRPRHRAEHRRCHRCGEPGRHHGERPRQPGDRTRRGSPPISTSSSACWASAGTARTTMRLRPNTADDAKPGTRTAAAGPQRIYVSNPNLPTRWSQPAPVPQIEARARTNSGAGLGRSERLNAARLRSRRWRRPPRPWFSWPAPSTPRATSCASFATS